MLGKVADAGRIRGIHRGIAKADDKTRQWRNKGKAGGKRASVLIGSRCHDDAGRHPERKPKGNKGQHINKKRRRKAPVRGSTNLAQGQFSFCLPFRGTAFRGTAFRV